MVRVHGGIGHVEEVLSRSGLWHPIGLGRKMASRVVFLTNAPKSSLDRPSTNRIPGFFDLLTRQQDYLSYSACPLHPRGHCHPFSCAACRTFISPNASRLGCVLTPRFMRIYVGLLLFIFVRSPTLLLSLSSLRSHPLCHLFHLLFLG